MKVEQFVMAYRVEQDRLRALLPEGYTSLRPVLRINVEIREKERVAVEFNTPAGAFGKRGWLNIAHWESPADPITWERRGGEVTFQSPFLRITYTRTGIEGGCPAERDNDGCFFPGNPTSFVPAETIDQNKEFCGCAFQWQFSPADAHGVSLGEDSVAAAPTPPQKQYARQPLTAQTAAAIPCQQILGAYAVCFEREETHKTHRILW